MVRREFRDKFESDVKRFGPQSSLLVRKERSCQLVIFLLDRLELFEATSSLHPPPSPLASPTALGQAGPEPKPTEWRRSAPEDSWKVVPDSLGSARRSNLKKSKLEVLAPEAAEEPAGVRCQ